jgi:hypothetical protein
MALDIMRITAALNAYPWTRGALTHRNEVAADYCAVGLLLRYAGVTQSEIAYTHDSTSVWARYRDLLEAEYGITEFETIGNIIRANDTATSHEEAIEQVQFVLDGGDLTEHVHSRQAAALEALGVVVRRGDDDDGTGCGAVSG